MTSNTLIEIYKKLDSDLLPINEQNTNFDTLDWDDDVAYAEYCLYGELKNVKLALEDANKFYINLQNALEERRLSHSYQDNRAHVQADFI